MLPINGLLTRYAADIDRTIQDLLVDTSPFIRGVIGYHLGWLDQNFQPATFERGKMFRPVVNLLVYEALTGDYRAALPVAASIEIIHNFSLLHDDIEDGDVERRGRATAWKIWGPALAINVGDYFYSLAYKALFQLDRNCFTPEQILAVSRLVNETCLALTEGQDLDLRFETLGDVSTEMYLEMIYKKTGALIEAAILAGAMLGTADETLLHHYHQFARHIGIAFQIKDDILGIWGDPAQTGKSVKNDLYRKKKTLPIIYMLTHSSGERRAQLKQLYAGLEPLSEAEIVFVRESLEIAGAKTYAQEAANRYQQESFSALNRLNLSGQAHTNLEMMTRFLLERTY